MSLQFRLSVYKMFIKSYSEPAASNFNIREKFRVKVESLFLLKKTMHLGSLPLKMGLAFMQINNVVMDLSAQFCQFLPWMFNNPD